MFPHGEPQTASEEVTTRVRILCGRYQLGEVIGRGGMGTVYRALDLLEGREYAIKLLTPSLDDEARRRFHREASIIAQLFHPHIVEIRDYGCAEDGGPFLVMELLRGQDLFRIIKGHRPLPLPYALSLLKQVGSALETMHRIGIIHRDIKPQNIFVCDEEDRSQPGREYRSVKLVDFGLSMPVGGEQLTTAGSIVGTLEYLAPEGTYGNSQALDAYSDQWSLAVVTYRLLSGELPFQADNAGSLMLRIREASPFHLRQHEPTLPPHVCEAVHRALSPQKVDRFPSVAAFIWALHHGSSLPTSISIAGIPVEAVPPPIEPPPKLERPPSSHGASGRSIVQVPAGRRKKIGAALLFGVLSLIVLAVFGRPREPRHAPAATRAVARAPMVTTAKATEMIEAAAAPEVITAPRTPAPPQQLGEAALDPRSTRTSGEEKGRRLSPHRGGLRRGTLKGQAAQSPIKSSAAAAGADDDESPPGEIEAAPTGTTAAAVTRPATSSDAPAAGEDRPVLARRRLQSCGKSPHLPAEVKQARRGSTVRGLYELCVDPQGLVQRARPLHGIPGADEAILSTLRTWRCPPWPVPSCSAIELEFVLE